MKITELQRKELIKFARRQYQIASRLVCPNIYQYLDFKIKERSPIYEGVSKFNKINIFIDEIIYGNKSIKTIKENIVWVIVHELFHIEQCINNLKYNEDIYYRSYIESSVELEVYKLIKKYKLIKLTSFHFSNKIKSIKQFSKRFKYIKYDYNNNTLMYGLAIAFVGLLKRKKDMDIMYTLITNKYIHTISFSFDNKDYYKLKVNGQYYNVFKYIFSKYNSKKYIAEFFASDKDQCNIVINIKEK